MNIKDEELQNHIEKGASPADGIDAYSYKKVFDALKQEPDFHLSVNFADRVIQKIEAKKESSSDFMWFGMGVLLFAVAAVVTIVLTNFKISFGALEFITGYPGLFIFAIAFILGLQWLDKKVVHPKTSH